MRKSFALVALVLAGSALPLLANAATGSSNNEVVSAKEDGAISLNAPAETLKAADREVFRQDDEGLHVVTLPDGSQIELFSFPNPPRRPSYPEACGLRHLAFEVDDVAQCKRELESMGVSVEPVRLDEYTHKRFVFFADPDGLPLELYESLENEGAADH